MKNNALDFFHFNKDCHNRENFDAGDIELNQYIREIMSQNEERNLSRHYVGINKNNFVSIVCLSSSVIKSNDAVKRTKNFPEKIELPTIKIGRLVVDKRYRNKSYGEQTLQKAISIFVEISKKIGVIGLTVDAKKKAISFYKKYGFKKLNPVRSKEYTPLILYTHLLKKNSPNLFDRI